MSCSLCYPPCALSLWLIVRSPSRSTNKQTKKSALSGKRSCFTTKPWPQRQSSRSRTTQLCYYFRTDQCRLLSAVSYGVTYRQYSVDL
ncbi:hypothetical protein EDD21DRAFT_383945, partial [Dissophora ornata]